MGTRGSAAGLFAGIGGLELGLGAHFETELMCEIHPGARLVLAERFPGLPVHDDVRSLKRLPKVDVVAAGFPCQDLSQAGRTVGIAGTRSGLVGEVFRLVGDRRRGPRWLVLENVPFMLHLGRGAALRFLTDSLEELGFAWAYRVVDSLGFGLPQRRHRVVLVASRSEDPRGVLFADEVGAPEPSTHEGVACGFYWTEGRGGLGWAPDAVPTLKGGSTIGIPSPPGIWTTNGDIVTPDLRDAERLQGFKADWTAAAAELGRKGDRWKLIGNAVSVPVSTWLADRLAEPGTHNPIEDVPLGDNVRWPSAAWGYRGKTCRVEISMYPLRVDRPHLEDFLAYDATPLSARATAGFLRRAEAGGLSFVPGFLDDARAHLARMRGDVPEEAPSGGYGRRGGRPRHPRRQHERRVAPRAEQEAVAVPLAI
jgi:DNA (cytosine-5)-methyltransferase 1